VPDPNNLTIYLKRLLTLTILGLLTIISITCLYCSYLLSIWMVHFVQKVIGFNQGGYSYGY
jgi:hypothetical protein